MPEETATYQVKAKSDIRNALEVLKGAVLQVLYENGASFPTPTDILYQCDIPPVKDNKGSETTLIRGILAHLSTNGHAKYKTEYAGWQITEEGVSVIEDSQ